MARHNIPCSFCKTEFHPGDTHWERWKKGKPTYCSRACVKARFEADALARIPDQPCTTCGKMFTLSSSQRDKFKSRPGTGLYCSTECLYASRKRHSRALWENGKMPPWGSERQRAAAKKLGEYSRANKKFGPDHPNYKLGEWTYEAKAERRARYEARKARRAAAPVVVPCMACGESTELTQHQRERWYKDGPQARFCCKACWQAKDSGENTERAINARRALASPKGYDYSQRMAEGYYDDATCAECGTVFSPDIEQRVHRKKYPDAAQYCSFECVTEVRMRRLENYRAENGVMQGPTHPSWKTGWHSKQAQEARRLVHHIKKHIKEGVSK